MELFDGDLLEVWPPLAPQITGMGVDASDLLIEDAPERVAAELGAFFAPD